MWSNDPDKGGERGCCDPERKSSLPEGARGRPGGRQSGLWGIAHLQQSGGPGQQPVQANLIAVKRQRPEEGTQACPCISDLGSPSPGHGSRQSGNQPSRDGIGPDLLLFLEIWGWNPSGLSLGTVRGMSVALQSVGSWKEPQLH